MPGDLSILPISPRQLPNNRQVHLIQLELFDDLEPAGFVVHPGDLGENITTRGLNLSGLPLRTVLHLGASAAVELTGLRTPCGQIDRLQKGLKQALSVKMPGGASFRAGVLGVVRTSGTLKAGDGIKAELPNQPWQSLPFL